MKDKQAILLSRAINIASKAHRGQVDKSGMPYIGHVMRVMEAGKTMDEKIVGVLHDIIEDTDWTPERLKERNFPHHIIAAVECLTKKSDDEPYEEFIERVKINPLAVKVKINDLEDNMNIRRLKEITDEDKERLNKYLKAHKELLSMKTYSLEAIRLVHPSAYEPWTSEDDDKLEQLWCEGKTPQELAELLGRNKGAITSRIKKLDLKNKYL